MPVFFLLVVIGFLGFHTTKIIEEQSSLKEASNNLVKNIIEDTNHLQEYLLTDDPDELARIEEEIERHDRLILMWIAALEYGTDSAQFKSGDVYDTWVEKGYEEQGRSVSFNPSIKEDIKEIEELKESSEVSYFNILNIHKREMSGRKKFNEEERREKEVRHLITDYISKSKDQRLIKDTSDLRYYSKEALYQYRDQTHQDNWFDSITTLRNDVASSENVLSPEEKSELLQYCDEYNVIAQSTGSLILEIDKLEEGCNQEFRIIKGYTLDIDEKIDIMNQDVTNLTNERVSRANSILSGSILFSVILGLMIALFISNILSAQLVRFRDAAMEIAGGNLEKRVELRTNDEVGDLAKAFNEMTGKLSRSYNDLKENAMELKASNEKLVSENAMRIEAEEKVGEANEELTVLNEELISSGEDLEKSNSELEREINERKFAQEELKESKKFLSDVFSSMQDGISIIDEEMNILLVNPIMKNWYSHVKPLVGRKCYDAYHGRNEKCEQCPSYRTLISGEADQETVPLRNLEGEIVGWLDLFTFPFIDEKTGNRKGVIEYVRDISDRKMAEESLKKYAKDLEESNTLKDLYRDIIHHDLSSPLTVIEGMSRMKLEEYPGDRELEMVLRNAGRCINLMDNAVRLSKLEVTEEIKKEDLDLKEIIDNIADDLQPIINKAGMTIEKKIDTIMPVKVNEIIEEVFMNLISNATKYAQEGKKIVLDGSDLGDSWRINIRDFGPGIEDKYKDGIFTRFNRKQREGVKGSGLGLAIAKKIIDIHGGSIRVEDNEVDYMDENGQTHTMIKGAVFVVEIPKDLD